MDRKMVTEELKEEQRNKRASGKRSRGMQALAMISCLVILVAVMYGGLTLYTMFQEKAVETGSGNVNGLGLDQAGNVVDKNGNVISVGSNSVVYSQEELDAKVAEAVLAAHNQGSEEVLDAIKTGLSDGSTVLETLRPFYPEYIVVASGGKYHFIPINYGLAQNQLLTENLNFLESGEVQYVLDGQVVSHKGIDVSKHQGTIDWTQVAQSGVEFAFIRVGNRGYETGRLVEDERFEENIQAAQAAGIKVGVYIYSQAINEQEVLEEANFVLEKIAPYQLDCPVVFDVEKVGGDGGRMNYISTEERTNLTRIFCQTVKDAGYRPMIYHNTEMGALMLNLPELEEYEKWFAAYTDTLYYPYAYSVWQYSQTGRVPGISKDVDLNICITPLWE